MKIELPQYPISKPAGIDFLDKVPADWVVRPLKTCLRKKRGAIKAGPFGTQLLASEMMPEGPVKVLNQRNVIDVDLINGENFISENKFAELIAFQVFPGDILLTTRGTIGRTCLVEHLSEPAILHPCLIRIQVDERIVSARYLMVLLTGAMIQDQLRILSNATTIEVIYTERLRRVFLPVPSPAEQRSILTFLNRETAKIDQLINVRREQIEGLQEQRLAVIHHAVTKGLNPNAQMKPSSVEWLGEIPASWEVRKMKFISLCNTTTLADHTQGDYVIRYIDIGNITSRGEVLEIQTFKFKDAPSRARRKLKLGVTIISTVRTYLKAIAFFDAPADNLIVSTGFAVLEPKSDIRPRFLYNLVASEYFIQKVISESKGVGYPAINVSDLINIKVPFPSTDEQDEILEHIDCETAKIDTLIAKYDLEIELLKEYRASLISQAVTGKIDVRSLVESPEPEAVGVL